MSSALTCPAGYALSGDTLTCSGCPAGSECSDSATSATCNAGFVSYGYASACTACASTPYGCSGASASLCAVTEYADASGNCVACTAGNECLDRQSLVNCALPEYNALSDDFHACYPCPAGSSCATAGATPSACGANKIPKLSDSSSCDACTGECPNSSMAYDYACPFGMYSASSVCANCPAGSECSGATPSAVSSGSFSPLGYSATFVCAPEAVCGLNGGDYTSCNAGLKYNTGTNACDDCTDPNLYCPDGIYEISAPYQAVGDDTTFKFSEVANQWWSGSAFSTESAIDSLYSPLLYRLCKPFLTLSLLDRNFRSKLARIQNEDRSFQEGGQQQRTPKLRWEGLHVRGAAK